ncbi:MAG: hypothetical protein CENE_01725 [Candidatus Celerinatantimonas neptuna]|nr:MAG: hypothetical protein CENE_01725 [Candidatus Celerinatantimonas neptuna]
MKVASENITIRPMDEQDIATAHAMTQALHWPHTRQDWQQISSLGPSLVMKVDHQIIGTACLVQQGNYASVGLIVIDDAFQGQGLGRRIMNEIMSKAEPDTHFFLTATEMGKPLYQKLGFNEYTKIEQYQNHIDSRLIPALSPKDSTVIRELKSEESGIIQTLMNGSTGMDRTAIAQKLAKQSTRILVTENNGQVTGLAMLRAFGRGYSIGPVIADHQENALALIARHLTQCDQQFVRLDINNQYSRIGESLTQFGLNKVDTVSQMVKGTQPKTQGPLTQYALVTQALG